MKVANTKKINERIMQVESIRQAFLTVRKEIYLDSILDLF